jgi:hypothetical protein
MGTTKNIKRRLFWKNTSHSDRRKMVKDGNQGLTKE